MNFLPLVSSILLYFIARVNGNHLYSLLICKWIFSGHNEPYSWDDPLGRFRCTLSTPHVHSWAMQFHNSSGMFFHYLFKCSEQPRGTLWAVF